MTSQENGDELRPEKAGRICRECGAHCCKYGGAIATEAEVLAIINSDYPNYFTRISQDVFITGWDEGICPYLVESECSIYDVRPLRCRAYPVFQVSTGEIFVADCPLLPLLSQDEIVHSSRLLTNCPTHIVQDAASHMKQHSKRLEMTSSRFKRLSVEEAISENPSVNVGTKNQ